MTTLLDIKQLFKSFGGVQAVRGVSFTLRRGERLALIGPNGAGKSTCFNLINGQLVPDSGDINILGKKANGKAPRYIWRLGVGRTFQITATFLSMSVMENVQMALLSHSRRTRNLVRTVHHLFRHEALELLDHVGMADQNDRICGTLAYGDLKRVELAMALANAPQLLLMDEPTAGLGSKERSDLMTLIDNLVRKRNIGVLFTEHDMNVIFSHADRILVLHEGELIAEGSPEEIRQHKGVQEVYLGKEQTPLLGN